MRRIDDISSLDVLVILPHRRPFVLIDRLVSYDYDTTEITVEYTVPKEGVFLEGGRFTAEGLMENVAQACAARVGFYNWLHEIPVRPGVVGAVKGMEVMLLPEIGQKLLTHIIPKAEALGLLMAEAKIMTESGSHVAKCTVKVAV